MLNAHLHALYGVRNCWQEIDKIFWTKKQCIEWLRQEYHLDQGGLYKLEMFDEFYDLDLCVGEDEYVRFCECKIPYCLRAKNEL